MMDLAGPSSDLKVRNVSLHSRGKPERGTLYLYRHHLVYKYIPKDQKHAAARAVSTSQHVDQSPRNSASIDQGHQDPSDSNIKRAAAPRPQAREVWIPYPMINHCMYRPAQTGQRRSDYHLSKGDNRESAEHDALPPTYGTNSLERSSLDSTYLAPHASPRRSSSPEHGSHYEGPLTREPAIRIRRRDFQMIALHFHQDEASSKKPNESAREVFYCLRSRCVFEKAQDMHAFHFKAPREELSADNVAYDARREFSRMGIGSKSAEGPGSAWRITDINAIYEYSPTYPSVLCVPRTVSDNILKYGASFRSKSRIPVLTYLHSNGGSISRASQPMVGLKSKRSPQDERLVSAIFSSHNSSQDSPEGSPPPASTDSMDGEHEDVPDLPISQADTALDQKMSIESFPAKKIYGSTRRALIVDARPKINAMANLTGGGGFEDISNYPGPPGTVVERTFLGIANIHVMRKSLDKVVESFANSDYLDLKPNPELLRNSGWLGHIEGLLNSAEMVARRVGLGGSHVLIHCSDGWDRTAQVAALAEIMLDPYYRTLPGFITLIQKDFMSFGHKFNHRHGIQGSDKWFEIENERVIPSRPKEGSEESPGMNAFGAKALSGAKNWFEKSRNNLFRPQNESRTDDDSPPSRPPSPPPNAMLHSPATSSTKKDREHKTDLQEIAPIFHQFLDAVWQLQHRRPDAFEFNERFLRRIFYQAYAGQYGEFLFNTEKDRTANAEKFASAWPHFVSRKQEFTNQQYVPKLDDPLLFPPRHWRDMDADVQWWSGLFGRKDEDMNTPRSLAPPDHMQKKDVPSLSTQPSTGSLEEPMDEKFQHSEEHMHRIETNNEVLNVSSVEASAARRAAQEESQTVSATLEQEEVKSRIRKDQVSPVTEEQLAIRGSATIQAPLQAEGLTSSRPAMQPLEGGDPLGVSTKVNEVSGGRFDAAAFARQSAFSER